MKAAIRVGFVSFCLALVAAVAYGQARTPYTRPSSITTPGSIQTSAAGDQFVCTSTTATCEVESAASATTMTSTVPAFDIGPTATPGANDRLACFSYGPSGSKTRVACVDAEGDFSASGNVSVPDTYSICFDGPSCTTNMKASGTAFEWRKGNTLIMDIGATNVNFWYRQNIFAGNIQSNGAAGTNAYTCNNVGCRLSLGNTARYLVDDGTNLEFIAPVQATTFEATTASGISLTGGGASGTLLITSNTPDSHTSTTVGAITLQASQDIDPTDQLFLLKDNAGTNIFRVAENGSVYTVNQITSASQVVSELGSFAGGNASTTLGFNSNTTDAQTSGTVPAIRLKATQNITDTDLLMSVEDSANNRRLSVAEDGQVAITGSLTTVGGGEIGVPVNFRATGSLISTNTLDVAGRVRLRNTAVSIPDSGGAGAAAYTQSTYEAGIEYTCNDADGCDVTMSEASVVTGFTMRFTNIGANTVNFTDTAGVTELAGNFAMGQWDTLVLAYVSDRWVEVSRSNN